MLTDKGEKFLGLAVKYQEILEKMLALGRDGGSEKLRISSMNSLGTHLLTPVYERFMAENPDIILEIKDADQAHLGVEEGITDLAFTVVKVEFCYCAGASCFCGAYGVFVCRGQPVYGQPE